MTADDPQATMIDRLSDDEVLDLLGPSWSKMSPAEREAYAYPGCRVPASRGRAPLQPARDDLMAKYRAAKARAAMRRAG